jgi:hypothetical protein
MTITYEATYFLPPLQGGPRLKSDTQGSAKPPPWAESCNRFAVNPTHTWAKFPRPFDPTRRGAPTARERRPPIAKCGHAFLLTSPFGGARRPGFSRFSRTRPRPQNSNAPAKKEKKNSRKSPARIRYAKGVAGGPHSRQRVVYNSYRLFAQR